MNTTSAFIVLCDYLLQDENGITWDAFDHLVAVGNGLGCNMEAVTAACDSTDGRVYYDESWYQFDGTTVATVEVR